MIVIITPRITSTIPAITPVKSIVIVESWAITRYVRWGQLHICFAVKFLIVAFTDEIYEVIIPGDRTSKTRMRSPFQFGQILLMPSTKGFDQMYG
ncbi:hypothetical protein ACWATR_31035 [Nostoc sp. UIC 10890]